VRAGSRTFYFYGAGGGGVNYPDQFLTDLRGRILDIELDGPYGESFKSPNKVTKALEKEVLATVRIY
jgi:hypothetical protein